MNQINPISGADLQERCDVFPPDGFRHLSKTNLKREKMSYLD